MRDPDYKSMKDFLISHTEADVFDIEEAIYWFANDWHGGQNSNLYSVLSTSKYHPGPISSGPEDSYLYDLLVGEYT